jgi:predicted enzyme related to lactoylglutathione lyase
VQKFYGGLFGWEFQPMGDKYLLYQTPGGEGGGFTKDYKPGAGGGTFYIYAHDVAAKLKEIVAAGGKVFLDTIPVPGYGWVAVFEDPMGNHVGLFSAENPPAGESPVPRM